MTTQSNFPTISENLNYHSANIQNGGQKASVGWVSVTFVDFEVPLTGKWYWEYITDNYVYAFMGITRLQFGSPHHHNTDFAFVQAGEYRYNGSNQANTASIGTGDIVGVYVNDGIIKVYVNNSLDHTYTQNLSIVGEPVFPAVFGSSNTTVNFGQDSSFLGVKTAQGNTDANGIGDFYYTPPDNALALCSANAPISDDIDPAQTDDDYPQKQMNVLTYTGNGSTRSITGLGFQPDLIFLKARNYASVQQVYDSTRGGTKQLYPSQTGPEATYSYLITSFDNDGWSMGNGNTDINYSSRTFCTWCFKATGGTTATNNDGNVTTTVQANTKAGFSIVTWTGTGTNSRTLGTGLSKQPELVFVKNRNASYAWIAYHHNMKNGGQPNDYGILQLSGNNAYSEGSGSLTYWDISEWSNSVFSVGGDTGVNGSGNNMLAYCWHGVDGYSKFGFYEGNGSSNGPYIHMGFRPRMVVIKAVDSAQMWAICDTERETFNPLGEKILVWNSTDTEFDASGFNFDVTSNGIKIRSSDTNINSSATFVYMAWADVPFRYNNSF